MVGGGGACVCVCERERERERERESQKQHKSIDNIPEKNKITLIQFCRWFGARVRLSYTLTRSNL